MKLWYSTTQRIAKKRIGYRWNKINLGRLLKPGDLISTCKGYNERIIEIEPEYSNYKLSTGLYVVDFNILTPTSSCSLVHCCTLPIKSKKEILEFWQRFDPDILNIANAVKDGKDVFNELGELNENY